MGRRGRGRGARAHHPAGAALAVLSLLPATAALLAPAAARAAATQESLVEDERVMLQSGAVAQAQALDDTVALGADGIRAVVRWRDFAPGRNAAEPPPGFDPADPGDYAPAARDPLDDLVRGAAARRLALLLSLSTPTPAWASGCAGSATRRRICAPDPAAYGAFLRALGAATPGATRTRTRVAAGCRARVGAAALDCRRPRRLRVTGFAHHPYTQGGSRPPTARGRPGTEITIASAGRLARILEAAAWQRRIPRRLPIRYTEHGFQTSPPDVTFGLPPAQHAE